MHLSGTIDVADVAVDAGYTGYKSISPLLLPLQHCVMRDVTDVNQGDASRRCGGRFALTDCQSASMHFTLPWPPTLFSTYLL